MHAARGRSFHSEIEKRYLHTDGRIIHARIAIALVRHADGRPWLAIDQLVDLSVEKRRERQLQSLLETEWPFPAKSASLRWNSKTADCSQ